MSCCSFLPPWFFSLTLTAPQSPSAALKKPTYSFFSLYKILPFFRWVLFFFLFSSLPGYAATLREFRFSTFKQLHSKSNFKLLPSPSSAAGTHRLVPQKNWSAGPAESVWSLSFSPTKLRSLSYPPEAYFLTPGFQGEALALNGVSFEKGVSFKTTAPFWQQPALAGFSVSFYFQPSLPFPLQGESLLIEKRGLAYQAVAKQRELVPLFRGFQVGIRNGKVFARFENSFAFGSSALPQGQRLLSLSLSQEIPKAFETDKWYHVLVRYDARSSVVALYLDGQLQAQRYATAAGTPSSTAYFFTLNELASYPLRVGQRFLGKIDELAFYTFPYPKTLHSPFSGQQPSSRRAFSPSAGWYQAEYHSKPFRFPTAPLFSDGSSARLGGASAFTRLKKISVLGNFSPEDLFLSLCTQPLVLIPQTPAWECSLLPLNTELTGARTMPMREVYRFSLRYKNTTRTPKFFDAVVFSYEPLLPPLPPKLLQVIPQVDGVRLVWQRGFQTEVMGYQLYYRKEQFQGEKKRKTLSYSALAQDSEGKKTFSYLLQGLEPRTLYYFALSAYTLTPAAEGRPAQKLESQLSQISSARLSSVAF